MAEPAQHHPTAPKPDSATAFILRLGRALHRYGLPAHRLEEAMTLASLRMGLKGQFLSTPTSITAAFGPLESQRTFMIRVSPGETSLEKLGILDELAGQVLRGEVSPEEGGARIEAVEAAPPRYGAYWTVPCCGLASGSASSFFGAGLPEMAAATVIGLVIGGLLVMSERVPLTARIIEPLGAVLAVLIARVVAEFVTPISPMIAVLGGLIILFPGLTVTVAMTELATRNLVSGTARMTSAGLVFAAIALGVALGERLAGHFLAASPVLEPVAIGPWLEASALVVAPLAFMVLFQARPKDAGWIVLASMVAFYGARVGTLFLGPELGTGLGALLVGCTSNLFARLTDRPALVPLVPAILMLVPGSIGFRSVASMVSQDMLTGMDTAFTMVLVATSLAVGLLMANVLVPHRRVM